MRAHGNSRYARRIAQCHARFNYFTNVPHDSQFQRRCRSLKHEYETMESSQEIRSHLNIRASSNIASPPISWQLGHLSRLYLGETPGNECPARIWDSVISIPYNGQQLSIVEYCVQSSTTPFSSTLRPPPKCSRIA